MGKTTLEDYKRLATATPTVAKEFEYFKKKILYPVLRNDMLHDPNIWGFDIHISGDLISGFDGYLAITPDEIAAIAYVKYYRANSAFILPEEVRIYYFDIAINFGNHKAIKTLQHCLCVPEDGIIGPVTREKMPLTSQECLCFHKKKLLSIFGLVGRKISHFLKRIFYGT